MPVVAGQSAPADAALPPVGPIVGKLVERETFIVDALTRKRTPAIIRKAIPADKEALRELSPGYNTDIPGEHRIYVLATKTGGVERVEGALCVKPGRYHGAKSLSIERIDSASWNMHGTEGREYSHVGSRLMEHAVIVSEKTGLEGRVHAEPQLPMSRLFYENLRFRGRGLTPDKNGLYFLSKAVVPKFKEELNHLVLESSGD
ncbi:MAG: hypothetical protein GF416_04945 [Candidatus Altiarchaeales archaeon]|nr:hypothetical protein [Candidatus Altiarchaeales archaeon]MBD3416464.1 hypothetical protein [Candidatus Altiarchaeales archaeon]